MAVQSELIQGLTFTASAIGLGSHAAQLWRSVRLQSVKGLSLWSFLLLTTTFSLSLILGIQYNIGPGLILATMSLILTVGVLFLISRTITIAYLCVVTVIVVGVKFGPTSIADAVLTTRYAEFVAFGWGLTFAIAFVPQVLKVRRLRNAKDLSRLSLLMTGLSVGLWLTFAIIVANRAMTFWLAIVLISLLELIRLKLTEHARAALPAESPPTNGETV